MHGDQVRLTIEASLSAVRDTTEAIDGWASHSWDRVRASRQLVDATADAVKPDGLLGIERSWKPGHKL